MGLKVEADTVSCFAALPARSHLATSTLLEQGGALGSRQRYGTVLLAHTVL